MRMAGLRLLERIAPAMRRKLRSKFTDSIETRTPR
jgi:hypothetical protein